MKKILLSLAAILCVASTLAQTPVVSSSQPSTTSANKAKGPKFTVSGYVKDETTREALGYVTVTVMDSLKAINATYSDDKGFFKLPVPEGKYTIKTSLLGYTGGETPLEVKANMVLDTLFMTEGVMAEAAVVIGQLVTSDIDKTTYNTAADPETPALTALEMMRKVPMLTVDGEDNLRLNGQTNYKILVNGKASTVMNSNYKDVLKSMPAGSIKNIEVITNPPAKYDAEGIGGIINIITDRKTIDGFNGSVGAGIRRFGSWNANAYIAAAIGKFSLSANYFTGRYFTKGGIQESERENFNSNQDKYMSTLGYGNGANTSNGFNIEASYEIDTMNLITLSGSGYFGNGDMSGDVYTNFRNAQNEVVRKYTNNTYNKFGYSSVDASLDYQHSFKRKDETLTASYKFSYNGNPSSYENNIFDVINYPERYEKADNVSYSSEHTAQIDYFNPINKNHQVEVGAKFIARPNMSDSKHWLLVNEIWEINPSRKNDLDYTQYIGSAYGAYQYKIKKFSVKVGFRAEYTINDGVYKLAVQDQSMFSRYFNIVPYLTIGFKPTDNDNLRMGYTQRLSRPGIWDLNPYYNDSDPMNVRTGNPNLDSEVSHTVDFGYNRFKGIYNINASLSYGICNNSIEEVYTNLPGGAILSRPENIGKIQRVRLNVGGGVRTLQGKLNFNVNMGAGYNIIDANNGTGLHNEGIILNFFGSINATPWKDGSIGVHGGYWYGGVGLQSESTGSYFCGFSVGHWFLNKTLRVTANISDPFTKYQVYSNKMADQNFSQISNYKRLGQNFGLSLQWRFGKTQAQVKKTRRGISNDDVKSGGGNQGGSGGGGQ